MATTMNKQWRLKNRPTGLVKESDFEWREEPVPLIDEGQLLIRHIYLSLDPANRGWMNPVKSYIPPVGLDTVMQGGGVGIVEESRHPGYQKGDIVQGMLGWQSYLLSNGKGLYKLPQSASIPLTAYLAVLGAIGYTAYFGLLDIGQPKTGETLVVSAAAGAVGSLVGQIGKIKGCHVVGIAGTDEKCHWLKEELGFDATINYKTEKIYPSLKERCPNGIDIYFENVGGEILDAVLSQINLKGRIPLCGLISQYNATERVPGPYNFARILTQRVRLEGFIVFDYASRYAEATAALSQWMVEGKLQYRVDIVDGLENAPIALNRLFDGSKKGKLIIKVSNEP